jgi:hypothetical protein
VRWFVPTAQCGPEERRHGLRRSIAEQSAAADCQKPPLVPRCGFRQRLSASVGLLLRSLVSWRGLEKNEAVAWLSEASHTVAPASSPHGQPVPGLAAGVASDSGRAVAQAEQWSRACWAVRLGVCARPHCLPHARVWLGLCPRHGGKSLVWGGWRRVRHRVRVGGYGPA